MPEENAAHPAAAPHPPGSAMGRWILPVVGCCIGRVAVLFFPQQPEHSYNSQEWRRAEELLDAVLEEATRPRPNILSTPWAVPATDLAVKYAQRGQLTFKEGTIVRKDLFVARRMGQTYDAIPADTMKPGAIRDAGVIVLTDDSKVHPGFPQGSLGGVDEIPGPLKNASFS